MVKDNNVVVVIDYDPNNRVHKLLRAVYGSRTFALDFYPVRFSFRSLVQNE